MNNRKNNNSALFIATLGVYLGLVLAGATPQVLASAAMTRSFDVKDEIDFKDSLDKKPDDENKRASDAVQGYLQDVEYFLVNLQRLRSKGNFDVYADIFDVAQNTMLPCVDSNLAGRYTPIRFVNPNPSSYSALVQLSRSMIYGYSLGDCVSNNEFNGVPAVDSRFSFKLDAKVFLVNIVVKKQTPQNAATLLGELSRTLKAYETDKSNRIRQRIIDKTTFKTENDQVFIVTRLPRAGLDSLLATSAK